MFRNNLKNLTIFVAVSSGLIYSAPAAFAEDVGDQYYPTAAEQVSSVENLEQAHQRKMHQTEQEYKDKMAALQNRYNEKSASDEAHLNKMIELREKAAALKEERTRKRAELDEAFMKHSRELQNTQFEKSNQYVLNVKDRKEYFENKKKKDASNGS